MIDNEDFKKTYLRANAIENRRLTIMTATFESAKKIAAVDMKKSQMGYRLRLKAYRDRQRDIMLSRASVPPSTATIGEFLLHRIASRRTNANVSSIQKSLHTRPRSDQPVKVSYHTSESVQNNDFKRSLTTLPSGKSSKESMIVSDGKELNQAIRPKSSDQLKKPHVREELSQNDLKTEQINTGFKAISTDRKTQRSHQKDIDFRQKKTRPKTSPTVRIKFQGLVGNLASIDESKSEQGELQNGFKTTSHDKMSSDECDPRLLTNENNQGSDFEKVQDEYEADMELGKMAKRQRSKVDLRPCTAWTRISQVMSHSANATSEDHGEYKDIHESSTSCLGLKQPNVVRNPFENMKGSLGSPSRQVRFFDADEVEERGMFYNLLLQNRLKRQQTRFEDLSVKIDTFCKNVEDSNKLPVTKPKEDSVQRLINEARRVTRRASSYISD